MKENQSNFIVKWLCKLLMFIFLLVFLNTANAQFGGTVFVAANQIAADTCNKAQGSFYVMPAPGSNMYLALWVTNQNGTQIQPSLNDPNLFENLPAGTYTISPVPIDLSDFTMNTTVSIDLVKELHSGSSTILPTCAVNGNIFLNPSNGTAPYSYLWNNSTTASTISLPIGTYNYSVRISDATGCILDEQFAINVPSTVLLNSQVTQPTCSVNGSIVLNATGSAPFSYLWSNNATTATMNTSAGTYTLNVIVTGNDGCTKTESFNIQTNQNPNVVINGCSNYIYNGINYSQTSIVTENFSQSGCIENRRTHINIYPSNIHQLNSSNNLFNCIDSSLLSVSGNNNLHIQSINWFNNGISIENTQSNILTTVAGGNGLGNAPNQFYRYPSGVKFDSQGNMYVADFGNHRVLKYPPNSTSLTNGVVVAGGNGSGSALNQLGQPDGIFIKGNFLYVADNGGDRIMKYPINPATFNGVGVIVAQEGLYHVRDVFVTQNDEIYVGEDGHCRVTKFPANSNEFTPGVVVAGSSVGMTASNAYNTWGVNGTALNQLSSAPAIWVQPNGDLYIADFYNHRVMKWAAGATSGVIAAGGNFQGNALNQLNTPHDIVFDALGNMYVSCGMFSYGSSIRESRIICFQPNSTQNSYGCVLINNLESIQRVAFDNNGDLYFSDPLNLRVAKLNKQLTKMVYQTGTYTAEVTMDNGCVYNVGPITITRNVASRDTVRLSNCGNVYYNGINYNTSTTLRDTFRTIAGCDSLYRVIYITIASVPNAVITNASNVSLGTTLTLANASTAKQIDWYNNGVKVATVHHASNITPTIAAGGNGWGSGNNQASYPYSVALDASGNLYTVNGHFHSVEKWDAATNTKTIVAGSGNQNIYGSGLDQLFSPRGIFVDNNYNVYVADGENHRVVKWAPGANTGVLVAGGNGGWNNSDQLNYPSAVFVDAASNIYIADEFNNRIQKWLPNATSGVTVAGNFHFGSPVINSTELNHPAGVFVKPNGDIYVADMFNNRVQKFAAGSSTAVTVAGQADGTPGNDACHLHYPHALYVDANDNVFVADGYNNRVQKWTPSATSGITVAGGEGNGFTSGIEALTLNANGDMFCGSVGSSSVTKWVNSNPTINTTFTPTTTGNYYAVLTFDNCCQLTTNTVDVNALRPGTPITGNPKSCTLNATTQLSNSNKNGVWRSSNTSVAIINENGLVTSISNGISNITYTYALAGFSYESRVDFIVANIAIPNTILGANSLCVGASTTYSCTTNGGTWSTTGRLSINQNGISTATSAGSSIIKYTITNAQGCSATQSKNILINSIPSTPTIAYATNTANPQGPSSGGIVSLCKNKTFTLLGNPSGGTWSKAGNSDLTIGALTGIVNTNNVAGSANVTYTYYNGCYSSRTISANVVTCTNKLSTTTSVEVNNEFLLYPNPANSYVNVKLDKVSPDEKLILTDLYGRELIRNNNLNIMTTIGLKQLAKGLYFVSLIKKNETITKKLIIE